MPWYVTQDKHWLKSDQNYIPIPSKYLTQNKHINKLKLTKLKTFDKINTALESSKKELICDFKLPVQLQTAITSHLLQTNTNVELVILDPEQRQLKKWREKGRTAAVRWGTDGQTEQPPVSPFLPHLHSKSDFYTQNHPPCFSLSHTLTVSSTVGSLSHVEQAHCEC